METKEIFEQMALRYDTPERVEQAKIIADAIRAEVGGPTATRALDYGCGTGLIGLDLLDLFHSMLFVDLSPQMIAQVQRKIEAAQLDHASALCADFCEEVPPGVKADYILATQVFLHVKDTGLLLNRLYGALNPQGWLMVVDFDKNDAIRSDLVHNGFDQEQLIRMAKQAGFAHAQAKTFHHGKQIFMKQDASLFLMTAKK